MLALVLAGPDPFHVWASLSLKAASVHRKGRLYGAGYVWAPKKWTWFASLRGWQGLPQTLRISLAGTLKGLCNGSWGQGSKDESFQSFPGYPLTWHTLFLQTYSQ